MKAIWKDVRKHLLSDVSFTMPVVVAGGVVLAVSLLGVTQTKTGLVPNGSLLTYLSQPGGAGMAMMIPVLVAYIPYFVAGESGLIPGFILGYTANNIIVISGVEIKAGFPGTLTLGLSTGYMVRWVRGLEVGKVIRSIMPILAISISTVLVLGFVYYFIMGYPISFLIQVLSGLMVTSNDDGKAVLAVFMGFFSEIDFGGPVTKAVSMFILSMINKGIMEPNGISKILVAVPPTGISLSTIIVKRKYSEEEHDNTKAVGIMGCLGITEGAILYATRDSKAIYPACIIGNIIGAPVEAFGNVACPVPHGGFTVFPVVENQPWFVVAILVGSVITALLLKVLKRDVLEERQKICPWILRQLFRQSY